jgi:hypothetical protein
MENGQRISNFKLDPDWAGEFTKLVNSPGEFTFLVNSLGEFT